MKHVIKITNGGAARAIYSDVIASGLRRLGTLNVERASHVEFDESLQGWTVQLADGEFLAGVDGDRQWVTSRIARVTFKTRDAALAAEVAYVQAHL